MNPPLLIPSPLDAARLAATPPPPSDDLLPGLPRAAVGALVGMDGVGKSWIVLSIAVAVAAGAAPWGAPGWGPTTPRPQDVLILAAEDGPEVQHRRIHALSRSRWVAPLWAAAAPRLHVVSLTQRLHLATRPDRWDAPRVDWETCDAIAAAARGCGLVILDPLRRFHQLNENTSTDADAVVEAAETIARESAAGVLLVHHASKMAVMSGQASRQQAARGASAFTDGVRWQAQAVRSEDGSPPIVTLGVSKLNYGAPPPTVELRIGADGVPVLARGGVRQGALRQVAP